MKQLFLASNSMNFGEQYLHYCLPALKAFLPENKKLVFVPYSSNKPEEYTKMVTSRLLDYGIKVTPIYSGEPKKILQSAKAIFIGGGNTFRLLKSLRDLDLVDVIIQRVNKGIPYIGVSAGANIASPSIKTTNDMPIVELQSLEALNIFPYQINPHYYDKDSNYKYMGETRETRILEYLQENSTPVIGLREGSWLEVSDNTAILKGPNKARMFTTSIIYEIEPGHEVPLTFEARSHTK